MIEMAAERADGKFVVQYILSRYPQTSITQRALLLVAGNGGALPSLLDLLLERSHAKISPDLLQQAAGNKYRGTSLIELLLSKYPATAELPRDVIIAALKNPYCARSIFHIVLRRQPQLTVTQDIIDAASQNPVMAGNMLQLLLKQALDLRSEQSADLVHRKLQSIENGLRDSLFMAACYGDEAILEYLISQSVSLSTVSGELGTALNVAIYADKINIVEILLENGSDPESYSHLYGTALQTASRKEQLAIIQALVKYGVQIDRPGMMGRTVLHTALRNGDLNTVKTLISLEASTTKQDHQGMTAMHHASVHTDSADCLDLLIKSGTSLDQEDSAQWTPLHWAAYANATAAVIRLVEAGASKTKRTTSGKTPLQIAMFRGHLHLRPKLLYAHSDGLDEEAVGEDHGDSCVMLAIW